MNNRFIEPIAWWGGEFFSGTPRKRTYWRRRAPTEFEKRSRRAEARAEARKLFAAYREELANTISHTPST